MIFLAVRHLLSKKRQSILIVLGILIGTAAYVTISSMMLGFQEKLLDQLVNNDAHIRISAREEKLDAKSMNSFPDAAHVFWRSPPSGRKDSAKINYPMGWFQKLDQDEEVVAYSPQVVVNVIFTKGKISRAGRAIGSHPSKQINVTNIQQYMLDSDFKLLGETGNRMILGKAMLELLGARIDDTVTLQAGGGTRPTTFKIVGAFQTGVKMIDEGTAFISLVDAQNLRGAYSEITDIAIKLRSPYEAREKAANLKQGQIDLVQSWQEISASILSVFKTQDIVRNAMTISIIVVAGFGIYNILSILVTQKRRDIAILRSMGFTPQDVMKLFFQQGLILGSIGGVLGILLGLGLSFAIAQIEIDSNRISSGDNRMLISYNIWIYIKGLLIAMASCIFSSLLPARQAGKMGPIEIIREGA